MSNQPRKTAIGFLKTIGFAIKTRIWIRASWDHKTEPAPNGWRRYHISNKTVYRQYIFCGKITRKGFRLTKCTYGGRDKCGNTIWKQLTKKHTDGFAHVFKLSRIGATISFYPNQPTRGICNAHVKSCQTLFYEIDNLPLDISEIRVFCGKRILNELFTTQKWLTYQSTSRKIQTKYSA